MQIHRYARANWVMLWPLGLALVLAAAVLTLAPSALLAQEEPAATAATVWYVDGNTGADGTCNTASAPCRTIQAAIERARSGDTILVAAGTYTYAGGSGCEGQTRAPAIVCVFTKQLTVRGGYASGNYTAANPSQNPTILDGQGRYRGVFVLSFANPGATALDLSGFTVRNGYGGAITSRPGRDGYFAFGGGMFVEYARSIVLRDMRFENNVTVGADRGSGAGGTGAGGALSFRTTDSALLENVTFTGNKALGGAGGDSGGNGQGGGIFTHSTTLTGNNLVFENNLAQAGNSGGSGLVGDEHAEGFGGAGNFEEGSKITLNNVVAHNNQAIGGNSNGIAGGGFGGAFMGEIAELTINDASIRDNLAKGGNAQTGWFGVGGGVMAIHSTVNINRAQVVGNTAQGGNGSNGEWGLPNGGGIMVTWVSDRYSSSFNITNSIISGNKAINGQGQQKVIGGGGGLWIQSTDAVLDHVTIANNQLTGAGLFGSGIQVLHTGGRGANVTIRNSLLTDHQHENVSAVDVLKPSSVTFAGGMFYNNTYNSSQDNPVIGSNRGTISGLETMSSGDPKYRNVGAGNYHITAQSAARNKVTNVTQAVDVDNEARNDGSPDYGADEYSPPPAPTVTYYGVSFNRTSINLNWSIDAEVASQVARYRLTYTYTPQGGSAVTEQVNVGTRTSYTLSDLQPLVVYTIKIDALDGTGGVVASTRTAAQVLTSNRRAFMPGIAR